jgi:hypothetical protein
MLANKNNKHIFIINPPSKESEMLRSNNTGSGQQQLKPLEEKIAHLQSELTEK